MNELLNGIIREAVTEIVLPVLGALLLTYGTMLASKLKQKTGVDITDKLNDLLHRALTRGAEALIAEYLSKGTTVPIAEVAAKLAKQVKVTNADTLKGLGSPDFDTLQKLARQTVERVLGGGSSKS